MKWSKLDPICVACLAKPRKVIGNGEESDEQSLIQNQARLIDQYKRTIDQYEILVNKLNNVPTSPLQKEK